MVSVLTLGSLIYCCIQCEGISGLIVLHLAVQFPQHHLLKRLLSIVYSCLLLQFFILKNKSSLVIISKSTIFRCPISFYVCLDF